MNRPFPVPMGVELAEQKRAALEHGHAAVEFSRPDMRLSHLLEIVNRVEAKEGVRFDGMLRDRCGCAIGIKFRSGGGR
jgi:hypothetical protein